MAVSLRPARRDDAALLTKVIDAAGEGLPRRVWAGLAGPDADVWAFGRSRAERDEGAFSWRNAVVAESGGRVCGAMITYLIGDEPEPVTDASLPVFVPLIELENMAPGTRYIQALAVVEDARRQGVASALIEQAQAQRGPRGLSLITTDTNTAARALYHRHGFIEVARRAIIPLGDWPAQAQEWVLMLRE